MVWATSQPKLVKFAPGTVDSITGKPYFYGSECGLYTVGIPCEAADPPRYSAWRVTKRPDGKRNGALPLGFFPTAKAAKQACEDHHVANP